MIQPKLEGTCHAGHSHGPHSKYRESLEVESLDTCYFHGIKVISNSRPSLFENPGKLVHSQSQLIASSITEDTYVIVL